MERDHLKELGVLREYNIKMDFKKSDGGGRELYCYVSGQGQMVGSCKHGFQE
jgi:hypothetical protein